MKKLIILSGVIALVFSSCGTKGGKLKTETDSLAYTMGMELGEYVKNMDSVMDTNFDVAKIAMAMNDVLKGDTSVMSKEKAMAFVREYYTVRKPRRDSIASVEFMAKMEKENSNAKKTASGLLYEIVSEGDAATKPDSAATVRVLYKVSDRNGKTIQDTYATNDTVSLNLARVIPGWSEGMKLIGKGGKIKLWLPSELAYGSHPMNRGIAPNSALVFEVDLIDVTPEAAQPAK